MRQGEPIGHLTHREGQPISPAQLARMVGESERVVVRLLAELERAGVPGKADNGAYMSRRMIRDEKDYQRYRARQAEAGKRGAAERWGSPSPPYPDPIRNTWGQHGSSSSSPSPYSSSMSTSSEESPQRSRGGVNDPSFQIFWDVYPRKVGKQAALRAWEKRKPDEALVEQMLAALEWQRRQDDWLHEGGRFIPHPSTWMKDGRWQDEPSQTPHVTANVGPHASR